MPLIKLCSSPQDGLIKVNKIRLLLIISNAKPASSDGGINCYASHFFKAVFNIPSSTDFSDLKENLQMGK